MIKVLKWVYNKGCQYERMRLKKLAAQLQSQIVMEQRSNQYMQPKDDARRIKQERFDEEVNQQVMQVLDRMIYPQSSPDYKVETVPPLIDHED